MGVRRVRRDEGTDQRRGIGQAMVSDEVESGALSSGKMVSSNFRAAKHGVLARRASSALKSSSFHTAGRMSGMSFPKSTRTPNTERSEVFPTSTGDIAATSASTR